MSNRTHYTSALTLTAAELEALARFVAHEAVVGDGSHTDNVLCRVIQNAKLIESNPVEQVIEANDPAKQPPSTDLHRE